MNSYPKVLVLSGYSFNQRCGGAITLTNLFRDWPSDKLAIVDADPNELDESICTKRFRLVNPRVASGNVEARIGVSHRIAKFLGLAGGVFPLKFTDELKRFILAFEPDYIYTQASQLSYMWLTKDILKLTKAKLVFHVMDDFLQTTYRSGLLSLIPRFLLAREMKSLVQTSRIRMGISEGMCLEYEERYGCEFYPFHNPVEPGQWGKEEDSPDGSKEFVVAYSGRIGLGARSSIIELATAVSKLRSSGLPICLKLYARATSEDASKILASAGGSESVVAFYPPPESVHDLKCALQTSHLLALPVDFDLESMRFLKLSMPTKLPAYMMSGTPLLAYGPDSVFSINFIKGNKVGFVCTEQSDLESVIKFAFENRNIGLDFAKSAREYAQRSFSGDVVRERFRLAFSKGG